MGNPPKYKKKIGNVEACIWEKEIQFKDKSFIKRTISLTKSYKDKEGNWKDLKIYLDVGKEIENTVHALNCCKIYDLENPPVKKAEQTAPPTGEYA